MKINLIFQISILVYHKLHVKKSMFLKKEKLYIQIIY